MDGCQLRRGVMLGVGRAPRSDERAGQYLYDRLDLEGQAPGKLSMHECQLGR
jgi:hypothetical protein